MKIRSILTRADLVLFALCLLAALSLPLLFGARERGSQVRVTVEGKLYGTWPLSEDARIEIRRDGHTNILVIEDGSLRMEEADCRSQVCVRTGRVSLTGQTIVCLPARVAAEITGGGDGEDVDAIVR